MVTYLFGANGKNSDEYKQFLKEEQDGFKEYKTKLLKEFQEYKNALKNEFKEYKKELGVYWDEPQIDNPKKWAIYSKDKKSRSIVDFQKM